MLIPSHFHRWPKVLDRALSERHGMPVRRFRLQLGQDLYTILSSLNERLKKNGATRLQVSISILMFDKASLCPRQ